MRIYYTGGFLNGQVLDNNNGLWYELNGDYYIPCLTLPTEEETPIGIWGQRYLRYIRQHKHLFYFNLLTSGKLNIHHVDVDRQAEEMFSRLVKQMAEREGIIEKLKTENQMLWVGKIQTFGFSAKSQL